MKVFGLGKFLAPESEETDEQFVSRRITSFLEGKDELNAISDISQYAKFFPSQIGEQAVPKLMQSLQKYAPNSDAITDILLILNAIVKSDSDTSAKNADVILSQNESLSTISNCFNSKKAAIRAQALSLVNRLMKLNIKAVQNGFLDNNNFQTNFLHLENDQNEAIRTSFLNIIPDFVKDNDVVQQSCAFYLMDTLSNQIRQGNWQLINTFYSLLENNATTQKMFVEMNHMSIFVKPIESGNENAVNFLSMLFTSNDSFNFRKNLINSGLLQPVVALAIRDNEKRSQYMKLLGLFIKGNAELCAKITENTSNLLETILNFSISSENEEERKSAMFFIECYLSKSQITPNILAKAICAEKYISLINSYNSKTIEVESLLNIACSCILANHETSVIFFDSEISFISNILKILMEISDFDSVVLISALKFICSAIWESTTTASKIIQYLSKHSREDSQSGVIFLLRLCSQDKSTKIRKISSLFILECLIFKDPQENGFNELISTLQAGQIKLSQLLSSIKEYTNDLTDDQSLWSEFAQELIHLIKKNSDILLTKQIIQSDSVQIASLKNMISKLTNDNEMLLDKNQNLQKESVAKDSEIERLQKENKEISSLIDVFENRLSQQQENESGTNNEVELLQQIDKMKKQIEDLQSSNQEEEIKILSEELDIKIGLQDELQKQLNYANQIANENKENLEKTELELIEAYNVIDEINKKIEKKKGKIQFLKESMKSNESNNINEEIKEKLDKQIQLYQELTQKFEETQKKSEKNNEVLSKTKDELLQANKKIDEINQIIKIKDEEIMKLKVEIQEKLEKLDLNKESNSSRDEEKIRKLIEENNRKQVCINKIQECMNEIKGKFENQILRINELIKLINAKNNENEKIKLETKKEITRLMGIIDELKLQKNEIQKKVEKREKTIKTLSSKIEEYEKVSKEKEQKILQENNNNLESLQIQISGKHKEIDQLKSQIDKMKKEQIKQNKQKDNEIQELSLKINEQVNKINEYEKDIQETKKTNLTLIEQKEKYEILNSKNEKTISDSLETIQAQKQELTKLKDENENNKDLIQKMNNEISLYKSNVINFENKIKELEQNKIMEANKRKQENEKLNEINNAKTEKLTKEINELKSKEEEQINLINSLKAKICELEQKCNNLINQKNEKIMEIRNEMNKILEQNSKDKINDLIKKYQNNIQQLEEQNEKNNAEIDNLKSEKEQLNKQNNEKVDLISTMENKINYLTNEKMNNDKSNNEKILDLQNQIKELKESQKEENKLIKQKIKDKYENKIRENNNKYQNELSKKDEEIKKLQCLIKNPVEENNQDNEKVRKEIAKIRNDYNMLEEKNSKIQLMNQNLIQEKNEDLKIINKLKEENHKLKTELETKAKMFKESDNNKSNLEEKQKIIQQKRENQKLYLLLQQKIKKQDTYKENLTKETEEKIKQSSQKYNEQISELKSQIQQYKIENNQQKEKYKQLLIKYQNNEEKSSLISRNDFKDKENKYKEEINNMKMTIEKNKTQTKIIYDSFQSLSKENDLLKRQIYQLQKENEFLKRSKTDEYKDSKSLSKTENNKVILNEAYLLIQKLHSKIDKLKVDNLSLHSKFTEFYSHILNIKDKERTYKEKHSKAILMINDVLSKSKSSSQRSKQ